PRGVAELLSPLSRVRRSRTAHGDDRALVRADSHRPIARWWSLPPGLACLGAWVPLSSTREGAMPMRSALLAAGVVLLAVTEGRAAEPPSNVLTPADVKAITGQEVQPLAKGESPGAGGCANFKTPDGHAFLGVNRHRGAGAYQTAVGSVPKDVYPQRA